MGNIESYLKRINFDKNFEKIKRKLKNKSVLIYGTGELFQYIHSYYDICSLNIIGVCDSKYDDSDYNKLFLGHKIIPKTKLENYNIDAVLVCVKEYIGVVLNLEFGLYKNSKTKIYPVAKIPFRELVKKLWTR